MLNEKEGKGELLLKNKDVADKINKYFGFKRFKSRLLLGSRKNIETYKRLNGNLEFVKRFHFIQSQWMRSKILKKRFEK